MSAEIKFLHLSDIHYMSNPDSESIRSELLQEIKKKFAQKIDCIILTGDFFQQGKYEKDDGDVLNFIKEICEKCLKPGYLKNNKDEWKKHIFFCPGNHDLDRNVSCYDKSNKKTISRSSALKTAIQNNADMINNNGDVNYECLVNRSFELFNETISKEMGIAQGYGEYQVFKEKIIDTTQKSSYDIFFVGINTALYAGQEKEKDKIREDLNTIQTELIEEKKKYFPKPKEAEKKFKEFLRLHNELINGGVEDENKLCFISQNSKNKIEDEIQKHSSKNAHFVIFFGHHPLEFLTSKAQKKFALFAKTLYTNKEDNYIYLCGHEHKPKAFKYKVEFEDSNDVNFIELEVGGDFADETKWNSLSFAVYTLKIDDSSKITLNGQIACWNKVIGKNSDTLLRERIYGWRYHNLIEINLPPCPPTLSTFELIYRTNIVDKNPPSDIVDKNPPSDIIDKNLPSDIIDKNLPSDIIDKNLPVEKSYSSKLSYYRDRYKLKE